MLENDRDPQVRQLLEAFRNEIREAEPFLDALQGHPDPFKVRVAGHGYEFIAHRSVEGRPNRAVVKIFMVSDGPLKGQAAVFFYKPSRIPSSRDRFSYGVCMIPRTGPEEGEVLEWLAFASSGFHPDARPSRMRRAFTFTVPD